MDLSELKNNYSEIEKKYKLPSFDRLNQDFEIDKIDKESEHLVRTVRKVVFEKIINSLNFLELLQNPVNAPRTYLPYLRSMSVEDKKTIEEIYSSLGELSLAALELEIEFSDKREAELIKRAFDVWNSHKIRFKKIVAGIAKPINNNVARKEKSYFG